MRGINLFVLVFLKTQCAVSVTLTSELSRSTCFGELIDYNPIYIKNLDIDLTIVVNRSIFKYIYQIEIFANIDIGIAPKLQEIQKNGCKPFKGE